MGRDRADRLGARSGRNVLASVEVRRVRRLGDVALLAVHQRVARPPRVGGAADLHRAALLSHRDDGPRRERHQRSRRSARQETRRARIPANGCRVGTRHSAARVRRRYARHSLLHGARRSEEPRRRDGIRAPAGRETHARSRREQHRADAAQPRDRRYAALHQQLERRRSQRHRSHHASGIATALSRSDRRRPALLREDGALPDQPLLHHSPFAVSKRIRGSRSTSTTRFLPRRRSVSRGT